MESIAPDNISVELFELLSFLRNTVEGILSSNNQNVWNVFGGLNRTKKAVYDILTNGLQVSTHNSEDKDEIYELCLLLHKEQLELSTLDEWIETHLFDHSLIDELKQQFADNQHLQKTYKEFAFVKNDVLFTAFINCLDALRQNSTDQLSNINLNLIEQATFMKELSPWISARMIEEYNINTSSNEDEESGEDICEVCNSERVFCTCHTYRHKRHSSQVSCISQSLLLKSALTAASEVEHPEHWYNDAVDQDDTTEVNADAVVESDMVDGPELEAMYIPRSSLRVARKQHRRSESDQLTTPKHHHRSKSDQVKSIHFDDAVLQPISSSLPKEVPQTDNGSHYYRDEDGQLFPKPFKGQSLISYLDSRSYDTGAQLDKENAHFSICEALIAAIEQMQCDVHEKESILINTMKKSYVETPSPPFSSDGGNPSSFKTNSTFSTSSSPNDEALVHQAPDTPSTSRHGTSISASWENISKVRSPIDETQIIEEDEIPIGDFTAEAVAKCLLKKFRNHSLPAASDLKWLVSEEDVPQQLLPLPNAMPVNPDDAHLLDNTPSVTVSDVRPVSLLRGNMEWAPPRAQIVFIPHAFVKKKVLLQRQHYRCAGCGLKVSLNLSRRFRYCEYLGKYFCSSCHQNKLAVIPAKVLSKWDFKKYPVSDFSKEFLRSIHRDPLFDVNGVAPSLYENIRAMNNTKSWRCQLYYIKKFLSTCRLAKCEQQEINELPAHIADEPHLYSVEDFIQTKNSELPTTLKNIVTSATNHIKIECQLCSARGFVCEFCRDGEDILYPFELHKVHICKDCKTCYHKGCFTLGKCARCERIRARKKLLAESPTLSDS